MRPFQLLDYFTLIHSRKSAFLGYNKLMVGDLRSVVRNFDRRQEEEQVALYAAQKGLPYVNLVNYPFVGDVLQLIPEETAKQFQLVAFMRLGPVIRVATTDPFQEGVSEIMNQLGAKLGGSFEPFVCSQTSINYALGRYAILVPKVAPQGAAATTKEQFENRVSSLKELQAAIERVSTTELLDTIISGAVALGASDIHFEPMEKSVHIRFRIDGRLLPIIEIPEKSYHALSSRIKTAAKLKLDVKKAAQDGRMTVSIGGEPTDIRVSTIPTTFGQTVELRLLAKHEMLSIDQLGFSPETYTAVMDAITKPEGLILFTGPTGSGKSTSLYSLLSLLNKPDRKVITLEDPVEYRLDGIEQVQVEPSSETVTTTRPGKDSRTTEQVVTGSFDFPQALRAALRQDPDIIMVGEIRDRDTAEIAVNAALTGHLVLSTLHTNSAPAAFARLIQMGVPKYLLADAVTLVVAQRLVRRLCPYCQGAGCQQCNNTGYKGRLLIAEHYQPDQQTVELIKREATLGEFEQHFNSLGNKSLVQDGLEKVAQGLTSEAEVKSVAQ